MAEEDGDDLPDTLSRAVRGAGRRFETVRRAYESGRGIGGSDLPHDDEGRVHIVCRRYAERRAVFLDAEGRPECFDADHPACRGCVEDIETGRIETWDP
jgi:hypothetical protein